MKSITTPLWKDNTKTCSLENIHGDRLNMELAPEMIINESTPVIRQNGDGDDD